jgi:AmmeMemoRadiSam system protein A
MIREKTLDHGALVPLWFLAKAGWTGPTVVLSLADGADGRLESLTTLGQAIAAAARASGRHVAIIASGDMSHRLTHGAPCGFHPRAHQFDETFMALIRDGDYHGIANIPPALRELAAEDASDSTLIAAAAVDWKTTGHEVLNYEAPFGVGYGVAVLFAEEPKPAPPQPAPASATNRQPAINPMLPIPPNPPTPPGQPAVRDGEILPALARQSIAAALTGSSESAPASASPYLSARRGVFVTLRERNGDLRGCAGTFLPSCPNIVEETWRSARLAALQDSRFSPVQARELPNLRFDVSVLHSMEKISSADELDPARYGLLVSTEDGRRALLLPGIEEIKTAEQQLICIRKKGWIGPREPVLMQRFQIDHFEEPK